MTYLIIFYFIGVLIVLVFLLMFAGWELSNSKKRKKDGQELISMMINSFMLFVFSWAFIFVVAVSLIFEWARRED